MDFQEKDAAGQENMLIHYPTCCIVVWWWDYLAYEIPGVFNLFKVDAYVV